MISAYKQPPRLCVKGEGAEDGEMADRRTGITGNTRRAVAEKCGELSRKA